MSTARVNDNVLAQVDSNVVTVATLNVMKGLTITIAGLAGVWGTACMISVLGKYGFIATMTAMFSAF